MNVMPPPGPQRRRLIFLVALLVVAFVVLYYQWSGSTPAPEVTTTRTNPVDTILNPTPGVKPAVRPGANPPAPGGQVPEALKLAQIERVPDEPEAAGRNLFRFGAPPPPPPPEPIKVAQPPPGPVGPPPPPPIPRVPLKYVMYYKHLDGRHIASLVDPSGALFQGVDGDTIDGRYKLHKVTPTSVEVSWPDGTGRRTIPLNGSGG